jgi:hypothetical protein
MQGLRVHWVICLEQFCSGPPDRGLFDYHNEFTLKKSKDLAASDDGSVQKDPFN